MSGLLQVCVVIPTALKRPDLLDRLVKNLNAQRVSKIIILDTSEGHRADVTISSPCSIIKDHGAFNWGRVNNYGATFCFFDRYLAFLNDDLDVPDTEWVGKMLEVFSDPAVGVASPVVHLPDGSVPGPAVKIDPSVESGLTATGQVKPGVFEVEACAGPALFVPRELFERIGGFDARYHFTHSDGVLGLTARANGFKNVVHGDVHITHYERSTRGPDDPEDTKLFRKEWLTAEA